MPSSSSVTSISLLVSSVEVLNARKIRVVYTQIPVMISETGSFDALNKTNYYIPTTAISNIESQDNLTFDINLSANLPFGSNSIQISNIKTPSGSMLVPNPTTVDFNSTFGSYDIKQISKGAENDSAYDILRKYLPAILDGDGWESVLKGIASGDNLTNEMISAAQKQIFIPTAKEKYLDRLGASHGVLRPPGILNDEEYRELTLSILNQQVTYQALEKILEIFYGRDYTKASMTSEAEPYALSNLDTLLLKIDGITHTITFKTNDFVNISQATAQEVCHVINRTLKLANSNAFAIVHNDGLSGTKKVRIFAAANGLFGRISCVGGKAQNILLFPTLESTTQVVGTQWSVTKTQNSKVKITWTGVGTNPSLYEVQVGDYANIYGNCFTTPNLGTFEILEVSVTGNYFVIENKNAVNVNPATQTGTDDIKFFTPTEHHLNSGLSAFVIGGENGVEVRYPATPDFKRDFDSASYVLGNSSVAIDSITRDVDGIVTATKSSHGLLVGDWVFIDGYGTQDNFFDVVTPGFSSVAGSTNKEKSEAIKLPDGRVLVIGGHPDSSSCYIYNPATGLVAAAGSLNKGRENPSAIMLDSDRVLLVGGSVSGTQIEDCEIYSILNNTWSVSPPMNAKREKPFLASINGKIYAYSGITADNDKVEFFDPATLTWTEGSASPNSHINGTYALIPDNKIIAIAGPLFSQKIDIFDANFNTWTQEPDFAISLIAPACVYFSLKRQDGEEYSNGAVILVNGVNPYLYNLAQKTWKTLTIDLALSSSTIRLIHIEGNKFFVACGGSQNMCYIVDIYNDKKIDTEVTGFSGPCIPLLLDNGNILLSGGASGANYKLYNLSNTKEFSGKITGLYQVTEKDASTFKYQTSEKRLFNAGSGYSFTKIAHVVDGRCPHLSDIKKNYIFTETSTETTVEISQNSNPKFIEGSSTTDFPDSGMVMLGLGYDYQTGPIYYVAKDNSKLVLDANQKFPITIPINSSIILLNEYEQLQDNFYVVNPSTKREYAQKFIKESKAAGINLEEDIVYPSDIGLGNAGNPESGASKLSDIVVVYAGDEVDATVKDLKE